MAIPVADNGDAVASAFDEMLHCARAPSSFGKFTVSNVGRFLAGVNQNQRSAVVDRGKRHTGIQARSVDNLAVEQLPGERVVGQRVFGGIRRVPGLLHERRQPRAVVSVTSDSTSLE